MEEERKMKNVTFLKNGSADFDEKNISFEHQWYYLVEQKSYLLKVMLCFKVTPLYLCPERQARVSTIPWIIIPFFLKSTFRI